MAPEEAEFVVKQATPPFPQDMGDEKRRVWGATETGRLLQVIYVLKNQEDVPYASVSPLDWAELQNAPSAKIVRIIHAMDLTPDMKKQLRRRRR
jgi:hypothetical protein